MKLNPNLVEHLIDESLEEDFVVIVDPDQTITIDPDDEDEDGISYTS